VSSFAQLFDSIERRAVELVQTLLLPSLVLPNLALSFEAGSSIIQLSSMLKHTSYYHTWIHKVVVIFRSLLFHFDIDSATLVSIIRLLLDVVPTLRSRQMQIVTLHNAIDACQRVLSTWARARARLCHFARSLLNDSRRYQRASTAAARDLHDLPESLDCRTLYFVLALCNHKPNQTKPNQAKPSKPETNTTSLVCLWQSNEPHVQGLFESEWAVRIWAQYVCNYTRSVLRNTHSYSYALTQ